MMKSCEQIFSFACFFGSIEALADRIGYPVVLRPLEKSGLPSRNRWIVWRPRELEGVFKKVQKETCFDTVAIKAWPANDNTKARSN